MSSRLRNEGNSNQGASLRFLQHDAVKPVVYSAKQPVRESPSLEQQFENAHREGFEAGYAEGLAKAKVEAAVLREKDLRRADVALGALSAALGEIKAAERMIRVEVQNRASMLAFELLQQLIGRELKLSANPVRDAIVRALALESTNLSATIRINPSDVEFVNEVADVVLEREYSVRPDHSVEPGGAIVEIGSAEIDAQISSALKRVGKVLLDGSIGSHEGD